MLRIGKQSFFLYIILFLFGVLSRLPLLEKAQTHWDGPDYTIAILHYSLIDRTPSPPGYPLYIALGKFFHLFFLDPHISILMVSVLFAGLGAIAFYISGKIFFNKKVGIASSAIFLTAPTIYYFGVTANPYGILPTTALIVATVVFQIIHKKKDYGFLLALVFSFSIGLRPQDAIFLSPLFILGILYLKTQERIKSILAFLFLSFSWLLPTVTAVGGVMQYFSYIIEFAKNDAVPNISLQRIEVTAPIILKGIFLTCGLTSIFLLLSVKFLSNLKYLKDTTLKKSLQYLLVFSFWIMPSVLFNTFVRSDHAAHQMAYLSALIILSSYFLVKISRNKFIPFIILIALFNLYTFFRIRDPKLEKPYVSQSFHYSEIIKNNIRIENLLHYMDTTFKPEETLLVVDPEIFRPISYHFKRFEVISFGALDTDSIPHANIVHRSFNWKYSRIINVNHEYLLSDKLKYIVVYNNNKEISINKLNYNDQKIKGNILLKVITIKNERVLKLSKGQISSLVR